MFARLFDLLGDAQSAGWTNVTGRRLQLAPELKEAKTTFQPWDGALRDGITPRVVFDRLTSSWFRHISRAMTSANLEDNDVIRERKQEITLDEVRIMAGVLLHICAESLPTFRAFVRSPSFSDLTSMPPRRLEFLVQLLTFDFDEVFNRFNRCIHADLQVFFTRFRAQLTVFLCPAGR